MATTQEARQVIDYLSAKMLDNYLLRAIERNGITSFNVGEMISFSFDDSRQVNGAVKFVFTLGQNDEGKIGTTVIAVEGVSARVNALKVIPVIETIDPTTLSSEWNFTTAYGQRKQYPTLGLKSSAGLILPVEMDTKKMGEMLADNLFAIVAKVGLEFQTGTYGKAVKATDVERWNIISKQPRNLWNNATSDLIRRAKGESVGDELLEMIRKG